MCRINNYVFPYPPRGTRLSGTGPTPDATTREAEYLTAGGTLRNTIYFTMPYVSHARRETVSIRKLSFEKNRF